MKKWPLVSRRKTWSKSLPLTAVTLAHEAVRRADLGEAENQFVVFAAWKLEWHFQSTRKLTNRAGIPFDIHAVPEDFAAETNVTSWHQHEIHLTRQKGILERREERLGFSEWKELVPDVLVVLYWAVLKYIRLRPDFQISKDDSVRQPLRP